MRLGLAANKLHHANENAALFRWLRACETGIRELLVRQARFGPKVQPVVQTRDKVSRVHAFSVPVENGCFRLKGTGPNQVDPGQQELFDEMTTFPFGEYDITYVVGRTYVKPNWTLAAKIIVEHIWQTQLGNLPSIQGDDRGYVVTGSGYLVPYRALSLLEPDTAPVGFA